MRTFWTIDKNNGVGHMVPGTYFVLFGMWSMVNQFRKYYRSLQRNGAPYKNTVTNKCFCLCGKLPGFEIEGVLKILVGFSLFLFNILKTVIGHQGLAHIQHASMQFFIGIAGIIDLLYHYKFRLPKNLDYVTTFMAFVAEGFTLTFHIHGADELYILVHILLTLTAWGGAVSLLVEMYYPDSLIAGLARSYMIFIQGTWFWQAAFILFVHEKPWDLDSTTMYMVVPAVFTWHMAGVFTFMAVLGGIVAFCYRVKDKRDYSHLNKPLISENGSVQEDLTIYKEEDSSDAEFP